jgi:hypothetical protein
MALPGSGEITLIGIRTELGGSGQVKLSEASDGTIATINANNSPGDRPNGTPPHQMSEFYGYDHSASSIPSAGAYPTTGNQLWTGNQGTSLQTDSVDLSSVAYVGSSVVGATGQFFFRFDSGNGFRSDAQVVEIDYNVDDFFMDFSSQGLTGIQTTSATTNTTYNHSSGWNNVTTATTNARWNHRDGTPPSSNTGVNADSIYYEASSNGSNKKVWLRFPSVTFTNNNVTIKTYGYGSNMGTLRFGVYMSGS